MWKYLSILVLSSLCCFGQGRRLMLGNNSGNNNPIYEFVTAFDTSSGVFNGTASFNAFYCGYWFVPTNQITLIAMGRYNFPGNDQSHPLILVSNCITLATGFVQCSSVTSNSFIYGNAMLEGSNISVTLFSNTLYWIGSSEGTFGTGLDTYYRKISQFSNNFAAVVYGDITNATPPSCPALVTNALVTVPVNFKFTSP